MQEIQWDTVVGCDRRRALAMEPRKQFRFRSRDLERQRSRQSTLLHAYSRLAKSVGVMMKYPLMNIEREVE